MVRTNGTRKLWWWVPFRYHARQATREFGEVFTAGVVLRIIVAVVVIFVAGALVQKRFFPELEFDWLLAFIKCMVAAVGMIAVGFLIMLVPPAITIGPKWIAVSQGQSSIHYPYAELEELRVEEDATPYPMLLLRRLSEREPKRYPISPRISLDELDDLLNIYRQRPRT